MSEATGRVPLAISAIQAQLGEVRSDLADASERALRHSDRIRHLEVQMHALERLERDMAKLDDLISDLAKWRFEVRGAGLTLSSIGGVVSGAVIALIQWLASR